MVSDVRSTSLDSVIKGFSTVVLCLGLILSWAKSDAAIPRSNDAFLRTHCYRCHGGSQGGLTRSTAEVVTFQNLCVELTGQR